MTWIFWRDLMASLAAYALVFGSYVGIGWGAARLARVTLRAEESPFTHFWFGWASTLLVLEAIQLVLPLTAFVAAPLLMLGLALLILFFREAAGSHRSRPTILYGLVVAAVAILLASLSMTEPQLGDSGLYYFSSIRWLNEHPIVLGLGNLHGRLAYNQSFFIYVAQLNLYPFFEHGHNLAVSLLLLVALAQCLRFVFPVIRAIVRGGVTRLHEVVSLLALPILVLMAFSASTSSPLPDYASTILQVLLIAQFATALSSTWSLEEGSGYTRYLLALLATAITLKLTNAAYALAMMTILLLMEMRAPRTTGGSALQRGATMLALPALILTIWVVRGIVLSGCPAYPSTWGCVKLEWAVPLQAIQAEADWIYSWARAPQLTPNQVLASWAWFDPWLKRMTTDNMAPVQTIALGFVGILAGGLLSRFRHHTQRMPWTAWLLVVPPAIGLLVWFFTAPDPRFSYGLIWAFQVAGIAVLLAALGPSSKAGRALVLLSLAALSVRIAWVVALDPPALDAGFTSGYQPIPTVALMRETTFHGLKVRVPKRGDRCWDSELPCTPYFNPWLKLVQRGIWPEFLVTHDP